MLPMPKTFTRKGGVIDSKFDTTLGPQKPAMMNGGSSFVTSPLAILANLWAVEALLDHPETGSRRLLFCVLCWRPLGSCRWYCVFHCAAL